MPLLSADRTFAVAYLCLAPASAVVARRASVRRKSDRAVARFLLVVAVVLTGIGLDRIFGLSERGANMARDSARAEGWYNDRAVVQTIAMVAALVVTILGLVLLRAARRVSRRCPSRICVRSTRDSGLRSLRLFACSASAEARDLCLQGGELSW